MKWFPLSHTKNIDTQEQLLNALESLKQHQETINMLKMKAAEEMPGNLHTKDSGDAGDEAQRKVRTAVTCGLQPVACGLPYPLLLTADTPGCPPPRDGQ